MKLSPSEERFILHWGEMGSRWGVNRTVAQIHALLYLSDTPLHAEEISDTLSVARSNTSTSLKELQGWGLVQITHVLGDRRDHFAALQDVWDIFTTITEERRRRELEPTLTVLRQCMLDDDPNLKAGPRKRMTEVLQFLELLTAWHDDVKGLPKSVALSVFKLGAKIRGLLGKTGNPSHPDN